MSACIGLFRTEVDATLGGGKRLPRGEICAEQAYL